MITISVCNQKGGVGKTTTTSAIGAYFVKNNKKTLIIDSDPQGNLTASIGVDPENVETLDAVLSGTKQIKDIVINTSIGDLVPCSLSLSDADRRYIQFRAYALLKSALKKVEEEYDYCIIDAPPSLGILSLNDLVASNYIVVPVNAASFSIQGIKALHQIVEEVKEDNKDLKFAGLLVTRFNGRTNLSRDVLEVLNTIASDLETKVFTSKIRQGVAIEAAQADELDIFSAAPKSGVAKDYAAFCEELLESIK